MRTIILTRDKKAIFKNVNSTRDDYEFRKSIYILEPTRVQNFMESEGAITGQELIFFENNPNPVSFEAKPKDLSGDYLDDVVIINFIQQTTDTFGKWNAPDLGFLSWFIKKPERIPFILMVGFIAYTIIKNMIFNGGI